LESGHISSVIVLRFPFELVVFGPFNLLTNPEVIFWSFNI